MGVYFIHRITNFNNQHNHICESFFLLILVFLEKWSKGYSDPKAIVKQTGNRRGSLLQRKSKNNFHCIYLTTGNLRCFLLPSVISKVIYLFLKEHTSVLVVHLQEFHGQIQPDKSKSHSLSCTSFSIRHPYIISTLLSFFLWLMDSQAKVVIEDFTLLCKK